MATSKHMGGTTELTLMADLRPGLVDVRNTTTYGTRLRILLRTLYAIRQRAVEDAVNKRFEGPLESLGMLHFVRWSIFDKDRRLLLAVAFDGPWEPYIRRIVERAGPLLDVIFCHCEGYEGHSTDKGYPAFSEWVREHQVDNEFFFVGSPNMTVDDGKYLRALDRIQRENPEPQSADLAIADLDIAKSALSTAGTAGESSELKDAVRMLRVLGALHKLRAVFPEPHPRVRHNDNHLFLQRTTKAILKDFDPGQLPNTITALPEVARALTWFERARSSERATTPHGGARESGALQGNVRTPYPDRSHGALLLMRFEDAEQGRSFLRSVHARVAMDGGEKSVDYNIALTYEGLQRLELPSDLLEVFPKEFREGMQARAGLLGDQGYNHPSRWDNPAQNWPPGDSTGAPVRLSTVDLILQLQTLSDASGGHAWTTDHPLYSEVENIAGIGGARVLAVEPLRRTFNPKTDRAVEHFGFDDGISQPAIGSKDSPLGELLLGHPNRHGETATPAELLQDGTFLVVRKLQQDVDAFNRTVSASGLKPAEAEACIMGRYRDGRALVKNGGENDFDFVDEANRAACPAQAHIRRANPRDGQPVPRMWRRGFSYGSRHTKATAHEERGLFFMAYNASIAEQFEVVQAWLSGGNRTGVPSEHNDALLGLPAPGGRRTLRFRRANEVIRVPLDVPAPGDLEGAPTPFVKLRWGMYLFVPSMRGLELLEGPPEALRLTGIPDPKIEEGSQIISRLRLLELVDKTTGAAPQDPVTEWKKLLEDRSAQESADAVWAAIRAQGGVLRTPYGVLVGSARHAMKVFRDEQTYSVREYWDRMERSLGALHLGMDQVPRKVGGACPGAFADLDERYTREVPEGRYAAEGYLVNEVTSAIDQQQAFDTALDEAKRVLQKPLAVAKGLGDLSADGYPVAMRDFVFDALAKLSQYWFGLPDGHGMQAGGLKLFEADGVTPPPHCPDDFGATARYIFSPNPTQFVLLEGQERGQMLRKAARDYVGGLRKKDKVRNELPELVAKLLEAHPDDNEDSNDLVACILLGAVHGFVGPVAGSFIKALIGWAERGDLWRLQQALREYQADQPSATGLQCAEAVLKAPLIEAMQRRPLPYLLHRTALEDTSLGEVPVRTGDRVVLGLLSATKDQPGKTEVLFGGCYGEEDAPRHACPGSKMAFGVMLGLAYALLQAGTIEQVDPVTLAIR